MEDPSTQNEEPNLAFKNKNLENNLAVLKEKKGPSFGHDDDFQPSNLEHELHNLVLEEKENNSINI